MSDNYSFSKLRETSQNIMRKINKDYPYIIESFLKDEATKLRKVAKNIAKKEVGTNRGKKKDWIEKKSYHRNFKVGKPYKYGESDTCIRAYNRAPHSHLVEYGHRIVPRGNKRATTRQGRIKQVEEQNSKGIVKGFKEGEMIFYQAETDFAPQFVEDCEIFLAKFVESCFDKSNITTTYGGHIS